MGLFSKDEDDIYLENADLDCEPRGPSVTKSAVAKVDEYLSPGEKVHYVATGGRFSIDGEDQDTMRHRLALTDKQMILKRKELFNSDIQTYNYEDISSVSLRKGIVYRKIAVEMPSAIYGIGVDASQGSDALQAMVAFIREKSKRQPRSGAGSSDGEVDPLQRIEQLKKLNDNGAISDEEFAQKKADLLEQI